MTSGVNDPMMTMQSQVRLLPYQRRWVEDDSPLKIAVKARQIGYSFAATLRAVLECIERRTTWIFLSKGERQARLLMEKVRDHLRTCGAVAEWNDSSFLKGTSTQQLEARLPNGSVIYGLPANPDTARGYSGNVTLDEFAFHSDAEKIYAALYPSITRGYSIEIISTPNGPRGKFYELAKAAGLDEKASAEGSQSRRLKTGSWSGHWCDIHQAIGEGLAKQLRIPESELVAMLRGGADDATWRQEFRCEFLSTATQWIPQELWAMSVSSEASASFGGEETEGGRRESDEGAAHSDSCPPGDGRTSGPLYAGWDVARKRDLSVIWVIERAGETSWTRGVIEMENRPTPEQMERARALLERGGDEAERGGEARIRRMAIDPSGMGLAIYEELAREFPGRVEGVQFTQATKEAMAVRVKDRMERGLLRVPDSEAMRQSFMALKRVVTATGLTRFDAEHDAHYGHADHFWACALAEAAAERGSARRPSWRDAFVTEGTPMINPKVFGLPHLAGARLL